MHCSEDTSIDYEELMFVPDTWEYNEGKLHSTYFFKGFFLVINTELFVRAYKKRTKIESSRGLSLNLYTSAGQSVKRKKKVSDDKIIKRSYSVDKGNNIRIVYFS